LAKYEYKIYNAKKDKELRNIWKEPDNFENFLNQMGQEGWDLISERDMGGVWTLIFQREI
jgi:hypothetical protein